MTFSLQVALAQLNFTVGDIAGNVQKITDATRDAAKAGADLVVFPEMAITGYPAEDLLFKDVFKQASMDAVAHIADALKDCTAAALVGGYWVEETTRYNATFLIEKGEVIHRQYKCRLPNYGVFDEKRLFTNGPTPEPFEWRGIKLGICICEDIWRAEVPEYLVKQGAELLVVQNASPYETGKARSRKDTVHQVATQTNVPVIYLNMVGGQDELVFDGGSFAVNGDGETVVQLPRFEDGVSVCGLRQAESGGYEIPHTASRPPLSELETMYQAMVLGLRDYVRKNGFKGVVIGLSGGIDSGLTAAIAVDALGAGAVHGLLMPSPYSSDHSIDDAESLAKALGIKVNTVAIEPAMQAFDAMLKPVFGDTQADTTEENIQARIRGNLLMALSNKLGYMVVTTGNKSEMSVGYATLYGDMCGGYSVLKDVYKTTCYALSRWRNNYQGDLGLLKGPAGITVIPEHMISKPPSAELRPDQKDEDSLPPYDVLDAILHGLIEERKGISELVADGFDEALVQQIAKMMYIAEYKRRQSPPGVKVSGMSFGRDRRYPITNHWVKQSQ